MIRFSTLLALLCFVGLPAAAQSMLPRCSPRLDGQVSINGCSCGYDPGGQLTGREAGWRWSCNLLRAGPVDPVAPAGLEPPGLPPGFVYAPQMSSAATASNTTPTTTANLGRSMRY